MFEELQQDGPDHSRLFVYQVIVEERTFDKGTGASKSKAKKAAALNALNALYDMEIQMRKYYWNKVELCVFVRQKNEDHLYNGYFQ